MHESNPLKKFFLHAMRDRKGVLTGDNHLEVFVERQCTNCQRTIAVGLVTVNLPIPITLEASGVELVRERPPTGVQVMDMGNYCPRCFSRWCSDAKTGSSLPTESLLQSFEGDTI